MKSKLIPALLITISLSGLLVFVALNSIQSTHTSTKDNSTDTNYTHPSLQTIIIERSQKQETEQNDPGKKNEENQKATNQENKNKKPKHHWGVDSASYTSQDFYKCVVDNFGKPIFWGRYLEDKDGVSKGLTKEEVKLLHDNDIKIMPIFNHFTDATGYDKGVAEAKEAIQYAKNIEIPANVVIFADIEPNYPVDAAFIEGWFDTMSASDYTPGIYGVFDNESNLSVAFDTAANNNAKIKEETIIWTNQPQEGITTKENAPKYNPITPKNSQTWAWQYGIDSETCNIDTNVIDSKLIDYLW